MNCQKARDLILTDHTDKEAPEAVRQQVKEHLAACGACRAFDAAVRQTAIQPFQETQRLEAPARLWSRVTSEIFAQQRGPAPSGLLERIRNLVAAPRPALTLSTIAALLVFGILATRLPYFSGSAQRRTLAASAIEDQIDYFAFGNGWDGTERLDVGLDTLFS
jgi:anti-sigma factor RsiW